MASVSPGTSSHHSLQRLGVQCHAHPRSFLLVADPQQIFLLGRQLPWVRIDRQLTGCFFRPAPGLDQLFLKLSNLKVVPQQVRRLRRREMKRFVQRHQTCRPMTEARLKLRSPEAQGHTLAVNYSFLETSSFGFKDPTGDPEGKSHWRTWGEGEPARGK